MSSFPQYTLDDDADVLAKLANVSKRSIANRKNAKKSTGPKTPEGKARSSGNSYKHGMRGRASVHPYEDADHFNKRRTEMYQSLGPSDAAEGVLVDLMIGSMWRMERIMISDTAILAKKAYEAADLFDLEMLDTVKNQVLGLSSNPAHFSRLLRLSARGCQWIVDRCALLIDTLQKRGFWYPTERDDVLHVFGLSTEDIFFNSLAYVIVEAFVKAGWSAECQGDLTRVQALIRSPAPEGMATWEYRHRVDGLTRATTEHDPEPSRAKLIKLLREEIAVIQ